MLFRKRTATVVWFLMFLVLLVYSAYTAEKGGIVILENPKGTGFTMEFKEFSARNKCELYLAEGDVLQVEITRESGKIALAVSGKNGSEPYTGNDLKSGIFTVTISEADKYEFRINGRDATGKIVVKKLE